MDFATLIHPDIRQAETLPSSLYTDPRYYAHQRETVFARSWHWLADQAVVRVGGDVHPCLMLEGMLEEPVLLSRDADDKLHLLSNVCTHRGNLVVEHAGNLKQLMCRYHGRKWRLDGQFASMPEFKEAENFPTERDHLRALPLAHWGRFLFGALAPMAPLEALLQPVADRMYWLPWAAFQHSPEHSRDYLVKANWALYCDNYLEGFHIPFVHPALSQALDYGSYRTELYEYANLQLGIARGNELAFDLPAGHPDAGMRVAGYYFWIFPNLMLNFYPWGLSINIVKPLGVGYTRVSFLTYIWKEELMELGAGAGLDRVEREDEEVVECVQKGVQSRIYQRGRYSPSREACTHHFHRLLTLCMAS
ncbi:MAG: Rieske 2Fe-2S domain-containing protein [Bacteroidetes bacterium]|jgi:choline monooxygenase|nr:Rieske 2Fe-2S domain-containing protein [Bacteroidota bacterium]